MLSIEERGEILRQLDSGIPFSTYTKTRLVSAIRSGEPSLFGTPADAECCDTGMDAPNRYVKTASGDCVKVFGGTVVDSSNCSR